MKKKHMGIFPIRFKKEQQDFLEEFKDVKCYYGILAGNMIEDNFINHIKPIPYFRKRSDIITPFKYDISMGDEKYIHYFPEYYKTKTEMLPYIEIYNSMLKEYKEKDPDKYKDYKIEIHGLGKYERHVC